MICQFPEPASQCQPNGFAFIGNVIEKAWSGGRCERHCGLKFWIVSPAGAFERVSPSMIEDIFSLTMPLQIVRHGPNEASSIVLQMQMARKPACVARNRSRFFHSEQEVAANEGIVMRVLPGSPDKTVPFVFREFADILNDTENEALLILRIFVVHRYSFAVTTHMLLRSACCRQATRARGSKPSNVIWSTLRSLCFCISRSRMVQLMTGICSFSRTKVTNGLGR